MQVEVDVFSGRPNPAWEIGPDEARMLAERLAALPAAPPSPEPDGLGYRGVVVRGLPGACAEVRLGEGRAHARCEDGPRVLADAGRAVERAVLATGRGRIDAGTLALIREAAGLDP